MTKTRVMIIMVFCMIMLSQIVGFADNGLVEVEVGISDNKIYMNQESFSNDELEFPLIKYNNVIYLPLAWNTMESLGFRFTIKEEVVTLTKEITDEKTKVALDQRSSAITKFKGDATVKDLEVLIDGEALKLGKYPVLKFANMNYIPLTWDVCQQMELYYSADKAQGMHINSISTESLEEEVNKANQVYLEKLAKIVRSINRGVSQTEAEKLVSIIVRECDRYGIDETWIMAMIWKESRFETDASYQGAYGIMQFLASTGKNFGLSKSDLMDPEKSIRAGVSYVNSGFKKFGTMELAILAYNQGSSRVEKGTYKTGYLDNVKEKREDILKWLK